MLAEVIGRPAMLEQTAEECSELAQACLKEARHLRGENRTWKRFDDIHESLIEEYVDVTICLEELEDAGYITKDRFMAVYDMKRSRMKNRLRKEAESKEAKKNEQN